MNPIQELFCLSKEFYDQVNKPYSKDERDRVMSSINEFLSKREELINKLDGPHSDEDRMLGKQILELDRKIQVKFNEIIHGIKEDIVTAKNQKRNTPKYINPYKSMLVNGVFYDKRK